MAYTPIGWLNDQAPAINQTNLNHMDNELAILDQANTEMTSAVGKITGNELITFVSGYYIFTKKSVGEVVDLTPQASATPINYAIIDTAEGEKFTINGTGANTARLWCFVTSANVVVSVSSSNLTGTDLVLTTPATASKLILNIKDTPGVCCKGEYVTNSIEDFDRDIYTLQKKSSAQIGIKILDNAPENFIRAAAELIYKVNAEGDLTELENARITLLTNSQSYVKTVRITLSDSTVVQCPYNTITKTNDGVAKNFKISLLINWEDFSIYENGVNTNYNSSYLEIAPNNNLLEEGYNRVKKVATTGVYNQTIISNSLVINTTSNTHYSVKKYAVEAGKIYNLSGNSVKLSYDVYPIAVFSTTNYTGESAVTADSAIIHTGTSATAANYNVTYYAEQNGYIYILKYDSGNEVYVFEAGYCSGLINRLTNSNDSPVKIQLFGDSITDDSWRDDHTTWATLLPSYIPQRKITVVNDAVGGSHIGHGKVAGGEARGAKHSDLDYNYVYDLMTNPDILKTDSDIIIMFTGANDFNSGQLGQWGDTTYDTFYGAARMICEYITTNTNAIFMVCTPLCRYSPTDRSRPVNDEGEPISGPTRPWTLRDFATAIIKTCAFYQVPVIDLFHDMGFNRNNIGHFTDEGLHPNLLGSHKLAEYISTKVREHLENDIYLQSF